MSFQKKLRNVGLGALAIVVVYHLLLIVALHSNDPIGMLIQLGARPDSNFNRATNASAKFDTSNPIADKWMEGIECIDRNMLNRGQLLTYQPHSGDPIDAIAYRLGYGFELPHFPNWNPIKSMYWRALLTITLLNKEQRTLLSADLLFTGTGLSKTEICSHLYKEQSEKCFQDPKAIVPILYPLACGGFQNEPDAFRVPIENHEREHLERLKENLVELETRCSTPTSL
ncbi:MAG TPA: hypothetical protein PLZ57_09160 [Pseudobdellovibrionaceae bacterium]|nr:hypothetical protein [Pseudobdellovibrionaceae bacterium]